MDDKNLNQATQGVTDQKADESIEIPEEIAAFLRGIMLDAQIHTDDEEMNNRVVSEMYVRFTTYLNSRVLDSIPDEKMKDLEELLKTIQDTKEIDEFITNNVPNYEAVYNTILLEFRDIYLGNSTLSDLPNAIKVKE